MATPEAKTSRPQPRSRDVTRERLLPRLVDDAGVVLLVAPAGYGKTTVAAQAADTQDLPVAWATLDVTDDDPVVLVSTLLAALARSGAAPGPLPGRLTGDEPAFSRRVLPAFRGAVERVGRPVHVVVDEVHLVSTAPAVLVLAGLADSLPRGSRLVLLGRRPPVLPLQRWSAAGRLDVIGAGDLAFDLAETAASLSRLGGPAGAQDPAAVHQATDGWPVAVYLGWRSRRAGRDVTVASVGTNLADYFDAEVVAEEDAAVLDLVRRTSMLTALSAPLCDAMLDDPAAGDRLLTAVRATPFITALQGRDAWWRVHPLLREHLLASLAARDPVAVRELHGRAARWFAAEGFADEAVHHALESTDPELIADVLWDPAIASLLVGRNTRVQAWLDRVPDPDLAAQAPLAVLAGWASVQAGDAAGVQRWGEAAERAWSSSWHHDMESDERAALLALLHTSAMHAGYEASADLALRCDRALAATHAVRPLALTLAGCGRVLAGREDDGMALLRRGHSLAVAADVGTTAVESLSLLSIVLRLADRGAEAREAAMAAERVWIAQDLGDSPSTTSLLRVATSPLRRVPEQADDVRRDLDQLVATGLVGDMSSLPWLTVLARSVMAEVLARLDDRDGAVQAAAAARTALAAVPASPLLLRAVERAEAAVAATGPLAVLSPAEQAVWSYVGTRLTVKEIAEQMHLSADTVKTHLSSIYRKLGLASRREAQRLYDDLAAGGRPTSPRGGAQAEVS